MYYFYYLIIFNIFILRKYNLKAQSKKTKGFTKSLREQTNEFNDIKKNTKSWNREDLRCGQNSQSDFMVLIQHKETYEKQKFNFTIKR